MKQHASSAIQFSGYPLRVRLPEKNGFKKATLAIVPPPQESEKKIKQNYGGSSANNPVNWDDSWFANYE
jgi:hypothetical protein